MRKNTSSKKSRGRRSSSAIGLLFKIALVPLAVIIVILAVWLLLDINSSVTEPGYDVYIYNGTKKIRMLPENDSVIKNGEVLINCEILSDYCRFSLAGDDDERTLVFADGGYAAFSDGSDSIKTQSGVLFMSETALMRRDTLFVPLSFFEEYVDGLVIDRYEDKRRIEIDIAKEEYKLLAGYDVTDGKIAEADVFGKIVPVSKKPEFVSDLSAYEKYMDPADRDKYLFLVNTSNRLSKDDKPENLYDLIHTRRDGRTTQQMELFAGKAMEAMMTEAYANGYTTLSITSAYRSYNYQQLLFNNQIEALRPYYGSEAEAKAAQAVAIPGSSEHQSGLCADLHNLPAASQAFESKPEYTWLLEHCADFGFILRYPKNKTDITGIMFEPWHYRFVGRYHAQKIMESGLCLEEYCERYYSGNM